MEPVMFQPSMKLLKKSLLLLMQHMTMGIERAEQIFKNERSKKDHIWLVIGWRGLKESGNLKITSVSFAWLTGV